MACYRAVLGVVFSLALIDNLLEHKTARAEDEDNGPDLERRLGRRGGGMRGGLVGTRGLGGLTEAGERGGGGGEAAGGGADELAAGA